VAEESLQLNPLHMDPAHMTELCKVNR
jgi:hypothetical protein